MAGIGHVAVGMLAARASSPGVRATVFWSLLSLLPDVDVIGFALGVRYADPWGHRGATHSLLFAVATGTLVGLAAGALRRPALRTAGLAIAVLVSHTLLDTMTDGGLGCALFWPFDLTRYFAPWRPIPVAPIGFGFLSLDGLLVSAVELGLFAPVLLFAFPRREPRAGTVVAAIGVWLLTVALISSSEVTRDDLTGMLLREDTAYAPGYSEPAFEAIERGQSATSVREQLGPPHREIWSYSPVDTRPPDERPASQQAGCALVTIEAGAVMMAHQPDACRSLGIEQGRSRDEVLSTLGAPVESCLQYTWSPGGARYRLRVVCVVGGRVHLIVRKWT